MLAQFCRNVAAFEAFIVTLCLTTRGTAAFADTGTVCVVPVFIFPYRECSREVLHEVLRKSGLMTLVVSITSSLRYYDSGGIIALLMSITSSDS